MSQLELIGLPHSNLVRTARLALAKKGVAYTLTPSMPHAPEVLAANPLGKIPALRHGDMTLGESWAICNYIDAAFDGPALHPESPTERAVTEQWVSYLLTAFDPVMIREYLFGYVFPKTEDKSPDRAQIDGAVPKLKGQMALLETAIADGVFRTDRFTIADAFLLPMLDYVRGFPEGQDALGANPKLSAYLESWLNDKDVKDTTPPPL
ncbi:MAG: glutathione S-transferase family protein [Pseudomonadota bacterium]